MQTSGLVLHSLYTKDGLFGLKHGRVISIYLEGCKNGPPKLGQYFAISRQPYVLEKKVNKEKCADGPSTQWGAADFSPSRAQGRKF